MIRKRVEGTRTISASIPGDLAGELDKLKKRYPRYSGLNSRLVEYGIRLAMAKINEFDITIIYSDRE